MNTSGPIGTNDFLPLRSQKVHLVDSKDREKLIQSVSSLGFQVVLIEASGITNDGAFFHEVQRAFQFDRGFGYNWDAFGDSLGDFADRTGRVAIVWADADFSIKHFLEGFLTAFYSLASLAWTPPRRGGNSCLQVELFLLGTGEAFSHI